MYRDDYIMRMIRRLGQVISYLMGLRQQGQYPLALLASDEAMRNTLGISSDQVASRNEREILALIRFADRDDSWRELTAYVAAILHAEACIYQAQGDDELVPPRALLALQLLSEAELAGEALPDYAPPREHLRELLGGFHLPIRTGLALVQLYEREGAYAQAEDLIFELIADAPADAELRATGVQLFTRLLTREPDDLAAGGLTPTEVRAALHELQAARAL
ncbi:MAG: DUF6483 family protein [Oscillochloridaceae bacterium umkhey_bin13]